MYTILTDVIPLVVFLTYWSLLPLHAPNDCHCMITAAQVLCYSDAGASCVFATRGKIS